MFICYVTCNVECCISWRSPFLLWLSRILTRKTAALTEDHSNFVQSFDQIHGYELTVGHYRLYVTLLVCKLLFRDI
jgi:hypothetical protein